MFSLVVSIFLNEFSSTGCQAKYWCLLFLFNPRSLQMVTIAMELKFARKAMANLNSTLKTRDIILLTKVHTVKAMFFPIVMYSYKTWTIRKADHQRIDAFKLWCWRRFLRVLWTARRLNHPILKDCSLEGQIPTNTETQT